MSASTSEAAFTTSVQADAGRRDLAIDSLRGIAILMVIGIHALHQPLDTPLARVVDAALRPAVPLFLFASGYLTARTRRVPLAKRLKAVLVPYTIAFAAAYLYMAIDNPAMDHRPWIALARYGLGYVFVYYYVPVYIGCTLALWLVLRLVDRASPDADGKLCVALALAIGFGLATAAYLDPLLAKLGLSNDTIEEARLRDLSFWFAFMAIGMIAGIARLDRPLAGMIPLICAGTITAFAIYAAVRIAALGDAAAYGSVALFAYAAPLCLLMLAVRPSSAALAFIGSGSYFIYLWHIFPIMLLRSSDAWRQADPAAASLVAYAAAATASIAALVVIRSVLPPRAAQWLGA